MSGSGTTSPAPPLPVSKLSALHINPAVVQHISYPSDDAVLITQDALQAATQYYELFFQDADELISGASSTNRRAVVEKKSNRTGSLNGVEPLSNGPENNTSKNKNNNNNNNNSEVSSTDDDDDYASSSSCTEADDDANNCDDSAVVTASSPLRVNHSPYHTFFPPVLTRRVRLHIIKQIIGHSPRHFSQWGWRKAVEYHALHEKNTQKNTLYEREPGHTSVTIPSGSPAMRFPVNSKASHIYQGLLQHPAASPTSGQGSKPAEDVPSPTGTGGGGDSNIVDDLLATLDGGTYTIPASQQGPEYFSQAAEDGSKTLIIVMVGLPARGKTFLAQKICRLLGWHGTRAKVQNIQVAWRRLLLEWEAAESMMRQNGSSGVSSNNVSTDPGQAPVEKPCTAATKTLPPASEVIRTPAHTSPCTYMLMHTALGPDGCYTPPDGHKALNNHQDVNNNNNNTNSNGCPNAGTPCVKPACLTAEHFKALITDPHSTARRLYRHVLRSFAEDCRMFFRDGGQVVVINDDFVTEELRDEAEKLFKPLTSQLFYMEVRRDSHLNGKFNECKVKDPIEYPRGAGINQKTAKKDFDERLNVLETYYETLSCASQADAEEELSATYPCSRSDTPPPPPPPKTPTDDHNNNNNCPSGSGNKSCGGKKTRSYIKISNAEKIETFGISGYLASRVISYVMNLSQVKIQHPIYFVRHGESGYNLEDRIGGNPFLTPQGMRDAAALLEFINSLKHHLHHIDHVEQNRSQNAKKNNNNNSNSSNNETEGLNGNSAAAKQASHAGRLEIWTSQLRRAIQTAELSERLLNIKTLRWSSLNEIHAGVCEDMTYAEVRATYPLIETFRKQSKYTFRYPDGESYQDLVVRLEPVIMELENADKVVVVVAHQAVLRCLLAYFGSTSAESSIRVKVPHRTVWRCTYDSKGIASLDELHLDNMEAGFQQVGESAWGKKKNEKA